MPPSPSHPLVRLERLKSLLETRDLHGVLPFHRVYTVVTKAVLESIDQGEFLYAATARRQVDRFLDYYEDALVAYWDSGRPPLAWLVLFERAGKSGQSRMLLLALGVSAHVNNDLPQALADLRTEPYHRQDFRRIDGIIGKKSQDIIRAAGISLGPLDFVVKAGMRTILFSWRCRAWNSFRQLRGKETTISTIERRAARIARALSLLPWPK